ncbi:peptidogalycan biosysnthesis protein, partial [Aphanothece microscopica]|uniref:peptidogalycan biosysnthesis protein n=1 Tax=Aphanothece microscopica TaxID=1049561 RepID=UPI003984DD31
MTDDPIEITLHPGVAAIPAAEWDALACPEAAAGGRPADPFTTHRFLSALETSGSVGPGTGWAPMPVVARAGGQAIGAMPLYAKAHSQGEYIFDHAWAQAYQRAGGRYYPKLLAAVPFTPATGRRFLTAPGCTDQGRAALAQAAVQIAAERGMSSFHANFCTEDEAAAG